MSSLGATLKKSRKTLRLTLVQVQDLTGISNAYLSQLENDKIKNPSVNILSKLSSVYKLPLKSLLADANMIDKQKKEEEEKNLSFAQKVAFFSENLNEEERNEVLKYLDYLKTRKQI